MITYYYKYLDFKLVLRYRPKHSIESEEYPSMEVSLLQCREKIVLNGSDDVQSLSSGNGHSC